MRGQGGGLRALSVTAEQHLPATRFADPPASLPAPRVPSQPARHRLLFGVLPLVVLGAGPTPVPTWGMVVSGFGVRAPSAAVGGETGSV